MGRPKWLRQIDKQWWVITEQDRNARKRIGVDSGSDDIPIPVGIIKGPNVDGSATGSRERRRGAVRCVMSVKNMIPLAQDTIVARARTCRIAPKVRYKIDAECVRRTHIASSADAPTSIIGVNGASELVVDLGRRNRSELLLSIGAPTVSPTGMNSAHSLFPPTKLKSPDPGEPRVVLSTTSFMSTICRGCRIQRDHENRRGASDPRQDVTIR